MEGNQNINVAAVYRTVADSLPAEGRDFKINLTTDGQGGKQSVTVDGLTPVGKAWVPFLTERLREQLKQSGVGVESQTNAGTQTVNTVRTAIVAEFDEKLKARIADHEAAAKQSADTAAKLRAERKSGVASAEERKADDARREAEAMVRHVQLVAVHVDKIRKTVAEKARNAAENDKANGRDWSVSQDAALETLFDRMNVENRIRTAEASILQMAEHAAQIDEIGARAVNAAKYYALNK